MWQTVAMQTLKTVKDGACIYERSYTGDVYPDLIGLAIPSYPSLRS